jgi:uncharacterized PurR-regulated membrane protein YhhQ (DUF165 family)
MSRRSNRERWLLPQSDYPSRPVLSESRLHSRRETSFLILVSTFLFASAMLPLLAAGKVVPLSRLLPGLSTPLDLALPVGALLFPLAFVALNVVGELFGSRRSIALALASLLIQLGVVALLRVGDVAAGAAPGADAFTPGLAFAVCCVVSQLIDAQIFGAMRTRMGRRRLGLRHGIATLLAQLFGWGAFMAVSYGLAESTGIAGSDPVVETGLSIAAAGAGYTFTAALIGTIPLYAAVGPLAVYLRIGRYDRRDRMRSGETGTPPWASGAGSPVGSGTSTRSRLGSADAAIPSAGSPQRAGARRASGPWSQAEEDFFVAGEQLGAADDGRPVDSFSDLAAPARSSTGSLAVVRLPDA